MYGGKPLPNTMSTCNIVMLTCDILIYVNMKYKYVDMQHNYINMRDLACRGQNYATIQIHEACM